MKQKMDDLTKAKLMYSGELLIIGIVFFIIGLLKFLGVMNSSSTTRRLIFHIITCAGALWLIGSFIWLLVSKKRRMKDSLFDKILNLPLGLFLLSYALYSFIIGMASWNVKQYTTCLFIAFTYVFIDYTVQAVYHYFHPLPSLIKAVEEDKKAEEEKLKKADNK